MNVDTLAGYGGSSTDPKPSETATPQGGYSDAWEYQASEQLPHHNVQSWNGGQSGLSSWELYGLSTLLAVPEPYPSFGDFNDFTMPDMAPWTFPNIAPNPSAYEPLMPTMHEPQVGFALNAGLQNQTAYQLLMPAVIERQLDFTVGAGPQHGTAAPPLAPSTPRQPNREERHTCPRCRNSFGRAGDYRRHMLKHDSPKFRCIVMDCYKTFARKDKLRDHIRQGHKITW